MILPFYTSYIILISGFSFSSFRQSIDLVYSLFLISLLHRFLYLLVLALLTTICASLLTSLYPNRTSTILVHCHCLNIIFFLAHTSCTSLLYHYVSIFLTLPLLLVRTFSAMIFIVLSLLPINSLFIYPYTNWRFLQKH